MNYVHNKNNTFRLVSRLPVNKQFAHFRKVHGPISFRDMVLKKEFDKKVGEIDNSSSKIDIIQRDMVDYIDSKKSIASDLAKIEPAKKAVEKISNNETPTKKEFTAYSHLQSQYEEHLCSDSESDSESQSSSNVQSASSVVNMSSEARSSIKENTPEKLNDLKIYLNSELKSATSSSNRLKKLFNKLRVAELEENERKRKIEESTDQDNSLVLGQSKRNRQSVHDFVENIPVDYSPLDDIGND